MLIWGKLKMGGRIDVEKFVCDVVIFRLQLTSSVLNKITSDKILLITYDNTVNLVSVRNFPVLPRCVVTFSDQ